MGDFAVAHLLITLILSAYIPSIAVKYLAEAFYTTALFIVPQRLLEYHIA